MSIWKRNSNDGHFQSVRELDDIGTYIHQHLPDATHHILHIRDQNMAWRNDPDQMHEIYNSISQAAGADVEHVKKYL